jgi:putative DNA primase/helicase
LRPDGRGKAEDARPFLRGCPTRGGVVRLVDDTDVTDRLGLAEGVESALAVMSGFARSGYVVPPIWAALSAGNLARLPVLPGIEVLNIFADSDAHGLGQRTAQEVARTWCSAGREALVASRPEGGDWNDQ